MKHSRIKLNRNIYLAAGIAICAFLLLYWLINHAFLNITVMPGDAIVLIDNAPLRVSRTGHASVTLAPGLHTIKVEADDYIDFVEKVNFKKSQRKKFTINLKPTPEPTRVAGLGTFPTKGKDANSIYYLADNGQRLYKAVFRLNDQDKPEAVTQIPITDKKLSGINEIIWSPDFELALLRKTDGVYLFDFKKYDFITQTEIKWGSDIGSIAWSPDNSKIAYYYTPASGERSLVFANIANTEINRVLNLAELGLENPLLRWSPDSERLIIIPRNTSSYDYNKIYLFNAYSRELKELTQTGSQIDALFSPDSSKIIYSTYSKDPANPVSSLISIANKDGENAMSLNLRAEIKKVSWQNDNQNLLAASYNEDKKRESIFGFNTADKEQTRFAITSINLGYINTIFLSDDEKIIFYQTSEGVFAIKAE